MTSKKDLLLQLLTQSSAFVQLDGRVAGVELPDWLRTESSVVLQLGYDMPVPIHDLQIDDAGIVATLSFRRTPFRCVLPWSAIFAIADDDGHRAVFTDQVPGDLPSPAAAPSPQPTPTSVSRPRPMPMPMPMPMARPMPQPSSEPSPSPATSSSSSSPPPPPPTKRPNHLKLVK